MINLERELEIEQLRDERRAMFAKVDDLLDTMPSLWRPFKRYAQTIQADRLLNDIESNLNHQAELMDEMRRLATLLISAFDDDGG